MTEKKKINLDMGKLLAPTALVVLIIFFSIVSKKFASPGTIVLVLDQVYYIALLAFGITFVIITAGIDLSIGSSMIMSALIGAYCYKNFMLTIWAALAVTVVIAALTGLINGFLVSYLRLPPFIATLGIMMVTLGFGGMMTKVETQYFPSRTAEPLYRSIFYKTSGGFPSGLIYMAILFIIASFLLNKTRLGRYAFAIGSNEEAVRLSGVNVAFWKTIVYIVCGAFAGLAAIVYGCAYTTFTPVTGNGLEMNAIAAVIVGGTSMSGGTGSMSGTLIGALLLSVLAVGLQLMGFQGHVQTFITGIVIISAVLFDNYRIRRQSV